MHNSLNKLEKYIEYEHFRGYDPYDTLLSWVPFHWFGKWVPVLAIQFQKRNPINIRSFLGIKKGINPKAFGLLLNAYSLLYKKNHNPSYLGKMHYLINWLRENYSKGYQGTGWGYNFPWASPEKHLKPYTPSAVVTGFICKGLFQYYIVTGDKTARELIVHAADFVLNELPRYSDNTGLCISYTPVKKDICYNASLLAGEVLAMKYFISPDESLKNLCVDLINFVVSRQKSDGHWAYSQSIDTGEERIQVDFHQGYIIESIYEISKNINIKNEIWEESIKKGLAFYKKNQFFANGKALWRLPKKYPVDIHNQAQGIITFSKLKMYSPDYLNFAKKIASWTVNNMQSNKGYFFYRKYRLYKNKTSYMRWGQAWMMLALSYLLSQK